MKITNKKAFTLVELLVVVTIIAILSVTAYMAMGGQTIKARDSKRIEDLSTIQTAFELYFVEFGRYPKTLESGLATAPDWKVPKKYLSIIPTDPGSAEHSYVYTPDGTTTYEIAATLEVDGDPENYEAYVVGNSDTPLTETDGGLGRYNLSGVLTLCTDGLQITSGQIGTSSGADNCVPYDPTN